MTPLNNTKSIDPKLLVSKGLDVSNFRSQEDPRVLAKAQAENKKKQAQKVVSTVITKGITSGTGINAPVVPTVIKTPVQQTNRSTELPKTEPTPTPTTLPNGQPIIAGNVSPQSLKGDPLNDLVGDMKNVVSEGRSPDINKLKQLYPEYASIDDKVLQELTADISNVIREGRTVDMEKLKQLYPELTQQQEDQSILDQVKQGAKDIGGGLLTSIMKTGEIATRPIQYAGEQLNKGIDYVAGTKTEPFKIAGATREQLPQVAQDVTGGRPSSLGFKGGELAGDIATSSVATAATAGLAGSALGGTTVATQAANIASKYPKLAALAGAFGEGAASTQAYNLQSEGKAATLGETAAGGAIGGALKGVGMLGGGLSSWVKNLRIDEKTKTALRTTTPDDLAQYIKATERAKGDLSAPTAYEIAAKKTDDAVSYISSLSDEIGNKIGSIRESIGSLPGRVDNIIKSVDDSMQKYGGIKITPRKEKVGIGIIGPDGQEFTKEITKGYKLTTPSGVSSLPEGEISIIKNLLKKLDNVKKKPTIKGLLDTKQYLNNKFNELDKKSPQMKAIVGSFRNNIDNEILSVTPNNYKPLLKKYGEYADLLEEINRLYGKEGEKGSTMVRNMFGSNSARTRELFTKIKELTGIDLYKEGQLARFVMDSMDEKRGLEQMLGNIPTTPLGIIGKVARKGLDVVSNPITQAKKILSPQKSAKTSQFLGQIRKKGSGVVASKIEDK